MRNTTLELGSTEKSSRGPPATVAPDPVTVTMSPSPRSNRSACRTAIWPRPWICCNRGFGGERVAGLQPAGGDVGAE
ncbi:hypothetical protein [Nonomuraea sp. NPDC023979]|uniref:hypothetical protein n=1 Tax=Nonomuraea sp. NPDC023979 TaxID=3154796 RepID=UPI0033EBD503